jgi:uncharacterized protein YdiU (UPF0061 family)
MNVSTLAELATLSNYSLMDTLSADPDATSTGEDYAPREVSSGHYVPVKPTPIGDPVYVVHSNTLFQELGFDDALAQTDDFKCVFSGDVSAVPPPMRKIGWATGYALSIYGTEYTQQCPFQTGNGYGDGRAISVLEAVIAGKRWEMQLKGGGRTPYCRGADGRAVLRSSVREFLAQEHMHALGVPTSRALCLYVSRTERVDRPWYSEQSRSFNPDILVSSPVAIATRVAPSFIRVGQLELFARRVRQQSHPGAMVELKMIVTHLIEREYDIDKALPFEAQIVILAREFRDRLTSLVAHWIRVGYCQGNFNSDNCAVGGYTLDYGPFGFCEAFDPFYQPWTGGGQHFCFFNQPAAAEANFHMFWTALRPLLIGDSESLASFDAVRESFSKSMQVQLERMWANKLGLAVFEDSLFKDLITLMVTTSVDYNMFFRELSGLPEDVSRVEKTFYQPIATSLKSQWSEWLLRWRRLVLSSQDPVSVLKQMKSANPKYTWREWFVVPAYQQAEAGDFTLINALQAVLTDPYGDQSGDLAEKYCRLRPDSFSQVGGVAHYSCSS